MLWQSWDRSLFIILYKMPTTHTFMNFFIFKLVGFGGGESGPFCLSLFDLMQTLKFQLWRMWFQVQNKNNSVLYKFLNTCYFLALKSLEKNKQNKIKCGTVWTQTSAGKTYYTKKDFVSPVTCQCGHLKF